MICPVGQCAIQGQEHNAARSPVRGTLKTIGKAVTFPLRWVGSKTFSLPGLLVRIPVLAIKHLFGKNTPGVSFRDELFCNKGFRWFSHENVTQQQAKEYLVYATAAGSTHRNNPSWMVPFGYSAIDANMFNTSLEKDGAVLFDRETGLKVMAYEKGDEVMIVFGALNSHEAHFDSSERGKSRSLRLKVIANCTFSIMGSCPDLYKKADKVVRKMLESDHLKNKKIILTGSSLGGSLTSYVSLKQQLPAIALNPFPLGPGLQKKIGHEKLQNADSLLTTVRSDSDCCSDLPLPIKLFDIAVNFLGVRTQGVFGKLQNVPRIHNGGGNNHIDIYGALAAKYDPALKGLCTDRFSKNHEVAIAAHKKLADIVSTLY